MFKIDAQKGDPQRYRHSNDLGPWNIALRGHPSLRGSVPLTLGRLFHDLCETWASHEMATSFRDPDESSSIAGDMFSATTDKRDITDGKPVTRWNVFLPGEREGAINTEQYMSLPDGRA